MRDIYSAHGGSSENLPMGLSGVRAGPTARQELIEQYRRVSGTGVKQFTLDGIKLKKRTALVRELEPIGAVRRRRYDLFLAADPDAPTLAFIHGGYWQMNDKENFAFFAEGLLPLGINLAVIEYTLAPTARLDRIVDEVRRSIRWLAEHLAECGGDPTRLYISGHSAGGHLTAMTMPLPEVRGGIAISGIYDLEPIRLNYLNEKLALDTAEAERNSPVRHLPATAGELVVAYGTRELPELCRQSIEYARAWTEQGLPGRLLPVDGADHFTILDALARPEGVLTRALLAMLGR
jgi:arylformamidase